jgi:hypothetical protein
MDKSLFTLADSESIDIVDKAVGDLRSLGATIVDPGPGGALFQSCLDQYMPQDLNAQFIKQNATLFPAGEDQIPILENLYVDPSLVPAKMTIRSFGTGGMGASEAGATSSGAGGGGGGGEGSAVGEGKYYFDRYLKRRGDANIKDLSDLINKSHYYSDTFKGNRFRDVKSSLERDNKPLTLDLRIRNANRIAIQQTVMQCMTVLKLDAVTYPTGNIPPAIIKAPVEPDINGRSHTAWTLLGTMGFPAMTVPAGFTSVVYDRVVDASAPGGTRLEGPVSEKLPVGIDFLALPFGEPTLFKIASAYEAATHHRTPPPEFGPVKPDK